MDRIIFFLFTLFLLTDCTPYNKVPETPIKAKLLVHNGENVGTSYKEVTFKTLENPRAMVGSYGDYMTGSVIKAATSFDVIIESPDKLFSDQGASPSLRYKLEDGVVIPLSKEAHFMLTNYYHLEYIIDFWKSHGLDFTDMKYRVYFDPTQRVNQEDLAYNPLGNFKLDKKAKMNAAFLAFSLPGMRSFLVFRNSKLEDLPISHNLTIWAHEFGHNMFDKAFTRRDHTVYKAKEGTKASYRLSGLNEGCADYFSATLTDSKLEEFTDSFVGNSSVKEERVLPVSFTSKDLEEGVSFYKWGSVFASTLYEIAETEGKITVAKQLYTALGKLRLDWETVGRGDDFHFHHIAKRMIDEGASVGKKQLYCKAFESRFNDDVNFPEIRSYCY